MIRVVSNIVFIYLLAQREKADARMHAWNVLVLIYTGAYNSLVGTIPCGQLDDLEVLALNLNKLAGTTPSEIGELVSKLKKIEFGVQFIDWNSSIKCWILDKSR